MATIKLPQVSPKMQTGTVRRWLKKAGDTIGRGEVLVEVETDEGLLQVESPLEGKLEQILMGEGKTAPAHAELAVIKEAGLGVDTPRSPGPLLVVPDEATPEPGHPQAAGKVIPIVMPKAGQSMEEGTILKWRVQPGARINKGDVIFEVETDKATMDVEATDAGRLARIVVAEGGTLPVLQPVAYLAEKDADVEAFLAQAEKEGTTETQRHREEPTKKQGDKEVESREVVARAWEKGGRVKASPAARKVAQQRGVDLQGIARGSGPGGRILSSDVPLTASPAGPARQRMTGMRRAIARALQQSKQTIPHFYVRLTVNAEPMLAFYQAHKAQYPCSINDVVVLGCARVLREFPAFRSRVEGEEIVESPSANIGIAVGTDEGLVVPVLTGAERLNLQQIGAETRRMAASARTGKIERMGRGTFTITNLGMFGTEEFAAIINPPEAAILAVGAVREAVLVKDGALRAGKVMTMTLSADHRIIDGMLAAKFLARLKEVLEAPEKLLQ